MKKAVFVLVLLLFLAACSSKPAPEPVIPAEPEEPEPVISEPEPVDEPAQPKQPVAKPKMTSTLTPARDISGAWAGSMTFNNNCPNPACRYTGKMNPPSISMNLVQAGNNVNGNLVVDFANFEVEELIPGMGCNTILGAGRTVMPIVNAVISSSRFSFTDVGGNYWELMITTDLIQGTITNTEPGCLGIESKNVKLSRQ